MMDPVAAQFISSLVKSLQMLCHSCMDFDDNIEIIGHINLRIDNQRKLDYIVNEQVSKQGHESTCFQSNSYHSLPPSKTRLEREQQSIGGSSDTTNIISHHKLDGSVPVLGGTHIQVDLSGPSPVTRSTYTSYPDGFSSTMGSSQLYFQSRNSQPHKIEMEQSSASVSQNDCTLSQSANVTKDSDETVCADGRDGTGTDSQMSLAMFPDTDGQLQIVPEPTQDVVVKTEPDDQLHSSLEKAGGSTGTTGMIEVSSAGSTFTAMQQTAVSSTNAHSDQVTLSTVPVTARSQPVSFNASLVPLNTEHAKQTAGVQGGVLVCAVGSMGTSLVPIAATLKPALSVAQGGLVALAQTSLPSSLQKGFTLASSHTSTGSIKAFPLLTSAPVVKKQKVETSRCIICGTQFRNDRLLGMHMRLVHRKKSCMKGKEKSVPSTDTPIPILPALSPSSAAVISFVGTKSEEAPKTTGLRIATDSFLELTKTKNGSSEAAKVHQQSGSETSKNGPIACQYCQILFWNNHDLLEHQKLCGQRYSTESGEGQSSNMCQTCQLVFPNAATLAEHKTSCCGEQASSVSSPTTCPICHLTFHDPALLSAHLWVCGKPESSVNVTESTVTVSISNSNGNYTASVNSNTCDECGKVFQGRTSLVDHVNSMHKGMSFTCPDCGEKFKWRTCVYRHKMRCCKGKNAAKNAKDNYKT